MYEITLLLGDNRIIAEVRLKSITQVAKFLDTVDFDFIEPVVITPKGKSLSPRKILEVWNA